MSTVTDATPVPRAAVARGHVAVRAGLVLVAAAQAEIGIWGLVSPKSFFNSYPGLGRHWVSALGPYNEHLLRDFAAAELGLAVLLLAAAIWFGRTLVLVAGTAFLAATVPHLAYHLTTTDSLVTSDNLASLGGFLLEGVVVATAMVAATRDRGGTG